MNSNYGIENMMSLFLCCRHCDKRIITYLLQQKKKKRSSLSGDTKIETSCAWPRTFLKDEKGDEDASKTNLSAHRPQTEK